MFQTLFHATILQYHSGKKCKLTAAPTLNNDDLKIYGVHNYVKSVTDISPHVKIITHSHKQVLLRE